jgi:hypothetical protein
MQASHSLERREAGHVDGLPQRPPPALLDRGGDGVDRIGARPVATTSATRIGEAERQGGRCRTSAHDHREASGEIKQ